MEAQQRPHIGMEVLDDADRFVGKIETVEQDHFVIQKGFFIPRSHRIPISAINTIGESEVTLRISREEALSSADHDWADHPDQGEIVPQIGDGEKSAARGGVDPHRQL